MPFGARKPYTEMFEVTQKELVREAASSEESKYKGFINQVYLNDIPNVLPERYIKKTAYIKTVADYTTGTVTVGSGTANIIGSSTDWASVSTAYTSDGGMILVSGYDTLYPIVFSAGTSLSFRDSLTWAEASGTGLSYSLFKPKYLLPSNFNYMAKDNPEDPNVVFVFLNGAKTFLTPWTNEEYDRNITATIGNLHAYTVKWSSGSVFLHVQANPDVSENVGFEYIPVLTGLRELTAGTATFTTGTAVVLTAAASLTAALDTSRTLVIRNDADGTGSASQWFQISSVANATAATLSAAWTGTSGTGVAYTVSEISEWPARFDDTIIYKTAWLADPESTSSEKFLKLYTESIQSEMMTEAKRKNSYTFKSFPGMR